MKQTTHIHAQDSHDRIRVGFITPWNQSCGLATYAKFLVSELEAAGNEVVVFAEHGETTTAPDETSVRRCWRRVSANCSPRDYEQLKQEIEEADVSVVHINCQARFFSSIPFCSMLRALKNRGIRIVVQLHNLFTVAEELSSLVKVADAVLVHTPENRLEAIANQAEPARVHVMPHGVLIREQMDESSKAALRRKLGISAEEPLLVTFGFIQPHKGLESLVEAVTHLRERGIPARGIIIGETRADDPNSAAYMRALRELVNRSGVAEFVSFITTFVPDEAVAEYLAAADLVIMNYRSQHFEASGACALAIGAGSVVLTSLAPAMMSFGDAVWHMTSGYPVGLSAELLLTSPSLRQEVRERARQYAIENSWSRIADRVVKTYRELAASPSAVQGTETSHKMRETPVLQASQGNCSKRFRVLIQNRPNTFSQRGGDTVVLEKISQGLAIRGYEVTVDVEAARDPRGYDLVHLFNFATPKLTEALAQRAMQAGVPYVVTSLYEDVPEFHNQSHALAGCLIDYVKVGQDREWWRSNKVSMASVARASRFPADWIANNASMICVNGEGEAKAIRRDFPDAGPICTVPLGHETAVKGDPEIFHKAFGVHDFVLCVGRLETRKNQLMLLKALEDCEVPVVLAAGGFTYQPEYEEAVRAFARKGQTLILGRLSPEMLAAAYAACRVHVLPSWYELPGLVSLEAAAYGKNVVVTRTGTSADYLRDKAFYCQPADEDSIYTAVMAAYHTPPRDGLAALAQEHTWDKTVTETIRAYEQVLGCGPREEVAAPRAATTTTVASYGFYDMSVNAMELEDAISQGESAAKSMDFARAEELLKRAEAIDPTSVRAIKGRAAVLLAQSKVPEAYELFERALKLSPTDPKVLAGRGMCELLSGRPREAVSFFERALSIQPDNLVALYQLIDCSHRLGEFKQAEKALKAYLSTHSDDAEMRFCLAGCLYKSGQLNACSTEVDKVLAIKPGHEGGRELQVRLETERIAAEASSLQQSESSAASSLAKQLISPEGLEELSQRIQEWTVNANASGADAEGSRAPVVVAETEPAPARGRDEETDLDTIIRRIESLKRAGKLSQAQELLSPILEASNLSAEQQVVARCLEAEFKVIMGDLEDAAFLYNKLLDKNPHLPRALCGKGALAAEAQDWKTAQAFFETSLDYDPRYDVALAGLGLCKMIANKTEEAFNLFRQAATINPENHRALLGVLQLGYPLKRYAEMEALVLAYLKLYPANLDMLYSFAGLLYAQGRIHEARMEVEKILIVQPQHESALELREVLDKVQTETTVMM